MEDLQQILLVADSAALILPSLKLGPYLVDLRSTWGDLVLMHQLFTSEQEGKHFDVCCPLPSRKHQGFGRFRDPITLPIGWYCMNQCLNADLVFRLLAPNRYDHLCVILTRLCTLAILTTLTLNRNKEKTVGSVASIFNLL